MIILEGKTVCGGIAEGCLKVCERAYPIAYKGIEAASLFDSSAEIARYKEAKEEADRQLEQLYQRTREEAGEEEAAIFKAHQLLIEDPNYEGTVCCYIENRQMRAAEAAEAAGETIAQVFASLNDSYLRERAADIRDVARRLMTILSETDSKTDSEMVSEKDTLTERGGFSAGAFSGERESAPVILLAEDLTPSETMQMDRSRISAFVTRRGSETSHTAILARTLGIPAVVGVECNFSASWNGRSAILDGEAGRLYIEPDAETRAALQVRLQKETEKKERLQALKGKENRTQDGRTIELYANIGSVEDADMALEQDAGGIGLFRTEFLYLGEGDYPAEETQFQAYRAVAERFAGKPVVIRTLDIGADKQAEYFHLEPEENPAMGYRAIRICLEQKELFRAQLRAIYRAGHYGSVRILLPMITSVEEVQETKAQTEEVKRELDQEGIPYGEVKLGVMIETPAAALISDLLAEEADFFSIGTNDLIQYTLAVDRQNPRLGRFYQPYHEGVMRLIRLTVKNAHQAGIPVGICGELAADLSLTEEWLRLGVEELSVAPAMILPVRERVRRCR